MQVVVLGSISAQEYRGEGDPSQEPVLCTLGTSSSSQTALLLGLPPTLPSGVGLHFPPLHL